MRIAGERPDCTGTAQFTTGIFGYAPSLALKTRGNSNKNHKGNPKTNRYFFFKEPPTLLLAVQRSVRTILNTALILVF